MVGVRGNARCNIASAAGQVTGGEFLAGNTSTGYAVHTVRGVYAGVVNKEPSGGVTWTNARGIEVNMDLDQGSAGNVNTITNAAMIWGKYNLPTASTYSVVTNGYGILLDNEAVGGTGQMLDAGFYLTDTNLSGGIKGWDFGIDFSGISSGSFGTADIRGVNGETLDNNTDGLWTSSGSIVANSNYVIEGLSTGRNILRTATFTFNDGTDATTIKVGTEITIQNNNHTNITDVGLTFIPPVDMPK